MDPRSALVLYGSESGSAEDVALELAQICERLRFTVQVCGLNSVRVADLRRHAVVLVAISTTGQGDLPFNAQSFWKALRSARLVAGSLAGVRFAAFGLGDSSYPNFNWAVRKLYNRLVQLGAESICSRGESDEQHPEGVDGAFAPWAADLRKRLLEILPLPDAVEPIPDDVLLAPKWLLDFADPDRGKAEPALPTATDTPDEPPEDLIPIPDGITATINSNTRITPRDHFQDTRHMILTLAGHHNYPPGATLTIYPKNFPSDVSAFLALMEWTAIADAPLHFVPSTPAANHPPPPIPHLPPSYPLTLRTLLTNHLDIMSVPRRSFFARLQHCTADAAHLERLREFTQPDLVDELYDYTTRPRRSILEALADFPSARIPWQHACAAIPPLRGRQFSIASGGALKRQSAPDNAPILNGTVPAARTAAADADAAAPPPLTTRADLLVGIVRYRTVIRRLRHGVATRYLASLRPGSRVTVSLHAGGLFASPAAAAGLLRAPVLMVAPGTGVAPMRALAWERAGAAASAGEKREGEALLVFGCRLRGCDDYFKEEWEGLGVRALTAYSREQENKVYVQDVIRQEAKSVFELVAERGGSVFVCGSSGKMPQAVQQALVDAFATEGEMAVEDAKAFLAKLEKEGRYKQETW